MTMFPMTLDETAHYLGLSKGTVARFANRGTLKGVLVENSGRPPAWHFDRDDVDDFIESCRMRPGECRAGRWQ